MSAIQTQKEAGLKYRPFQKAGIILALCAVLLSAQTLTLAAPENEKSETVRSVHVKDGEIENSTLVIGSHLIYIGALTDALYELATRSAADFDQNDMYYKSELSDGRWYLVSSASSLEDISVSGTPVDSSVIESLEFTHHTKSDGVTYDLCTGETPAVFDIPDPFDLEGMEELQPLYLQYQLLVEKEEDTWTESDRIYQKMIGDFFKIDIRNENTDKCDKNLKGLQDYRNILIGAQAEAAMTETLDSVMGSVDAERRTESLTELGRELELLELHAGGMSSEEEKEEKKRKEEIAESAMEKAGKYRQEEDYNGALETLRDAYEETGLSKLKTEMDDLRVERAIADSQKALQNFEEELKGRKEEQKRLEEEIAGLDEEISRLKELITDLGGGDGEPEEETPAQPPEDGVQKDSPEAEKYKKQLEEKKEERREKEERQKELEEKQLEKNLSREREETLAEIRKLLEELYEETRDERLYYQIQELGNNRKKLKAEDRKEDGFVTNEGIIQAIGECIGNVETSIRRYEGKLLEEGDTITGKIRYKYSALLIDGAGTGNTAACDTGAESLCDLSAILEDKLAHPDRELALLTDDLVPAAFGIYQAALSGGASEEYQKAAAQKSSRAVLTRCLETQQNQTNAYRLEYQTFLSAKAKRMNSGKAGEYFLSLIGGADGLEKGMIQDAAASYLKQTVSEHLAWLKGSYTAMIQENFGETEIGKLKEEEDSLLLQKRTALDQNDLAAARKLDAALLAKRQDVDAAREKLTAVQHSPNASEADKAAAAAQLDGGSGASVLTNAADRMILDIKDGDLDSFRNGMAAVEALGGLDPDAASDALSRVRGALAEELSKEEGGRNAEELEEISRAAEELDETLAAGGGGDAADAGGGQAGGKPDGAQLEAFLKRLLGVSFEELPEKKKAGVLLAVEWYAKAEADFKAAALAGRWANAMYGEGNRYLYEKPESGAGVYVSLKTVSNCLNYRYIFDDSLEIATLQKGMEYYRFQTGDCRFETTGGKSGRMKDKALRRQEVYIPEDGCSGLFSCGAEYIDRAAVGMLVTAPVKAEAEEIYKAMREGGPD